MKKSVLLTLCGALLIASACLLAGYNSYLGDMATANSDSLLESYQEDADVTVPVSAAPGEQASVMVNLNSTSGIPLGEQSSTEVPVTGMLVIDAIDLKLPVISEWSYPRLKISACRYSGTAEDGNLILLAHNYSRHFGRLHDLTKGDKVQFTDVNGHQYHYEVSKVETLGKYDLNKLTNTDYALTLFTCTPGGQKRVVVRCIKTE